MENRWAYRSPSDIDAILDFRPIGLVHGTVRNYSLGGNSSSYAQLATRGIARQPGRHTACMQALGPSLMHTAQYQMEV
jgi:hypothetical protein